MKVESSTKETSELVQVPGLLECLVKYQVASAEAALDWKGPRLSRESWNQTLAFLKWANDTHHSEAQLRLFCRPHPGEWAAWAFPQIGGTGLSSKELGESTPEWQLQRIQFPNHEGWRLLGTIHSHADVGAFQSGTDHADERAQDGLHITVGDLGKLKFSIHARFVMGGNTMPVDLSKFWDIEHPEVPAWVARFLPDDLEDQLARIQMCEPPPVAQAFPEKWKENYQVPKRELLPTCYQGGWRYDKDWDVRAEVAREKFPDYIPSHAAADKGACGERAEECAESIRMICEGDPRSPVGMECSLEDAISHLEMLLENPELADVVRELDDLQASPEELLDVLRHRLEKLEAVEVML